MSTTATVLTSLRAEDENIQWCGPSGLFQKAADEIDRLRSALLEVRDLIDGYVDIRDGASGPLPNNAMRAQQIIDEALT